MQDDEMIMSDEASTDLDQEEEIDPVTGLPKKKPVADIDEEEEDDDDDDTM